MSLLAVVLLVQRPLNSTTCGVTAKHNVCSLSALLTSLPDKGSPPLPTSVVPLADKHLYICIETHSFMCTFGAADLESITNNGNVGKYEIDIILGNQK